jgi:hypothetical protein
MTDKPARSKGRQAMTEVTYTTQEPLRQKLLAALDTALGIGGAEGSVSLKNGDWAVDVVRSSRLGRECGRFTVTRLRDGKKGSVTAGADGRIRLSSDWGLDTPLIPIIPSIEEFARLLDRTALPSAALEALQGFWRRDAR